MSNRKLIEELRYREMSLDDLPEVSELCGMAADALEQFEWREMESAPKEEYILISIDEGTARNSVYEAILYDGIFFYGLNSIAADKVLAWLPLPE